jgi:ribosomal 50S subunit-associated protein YjgA (DUF615 family)
MIERELDECACGIPQPMHPPVRLEVPAIAREAALALEELHHQLIQSGLSEAQARVRVLTDPRASDPQVRSLLPKGLERRRRGRPPDAGSVTARATDLAQSLIQREGLTQAEAVREVLRQVPGADGGNIRKYLRKRRVGGLHGGGAGSTPASGP